MLELVGNKARRGTGGSTDGSTFERITGEEPDDGTAGSTDTGARQRIAAGAPVDLATADENENTEGGTDKRQTTHVFHG